MQSETGIFTIVLNPSPLPHLIRFLGGLIRISTIGTTMILRLAGRVGAVAGFFREGLV